MTTTISFIPVPNPSNSSDAKTHIELLTAIYVRNYEMLCRIACSYVKDYGVANDVCQDTYESVLKSVCDGMRLESTELKRYLVRALHNKAKDLLKKASVRCTVCTNFDDPVDSFEANGKACLSDDIDSFSNVHSDTDAEPESESDDTTNVDIMDDDCEISDLEAHLSLVEKCVPSLPHEQCDIFCLRMLGGTYDDVKDANGCIHLMAPDARKASYNEISELFGISINTAISRFQYAQNNIRKMLKLA